MKAKDVIKCIKKEIDWFYKYSEDPSVYRRGEEQSSIISNIFSKQDLLDSGLSQETIGLFYKDGVNHLTMFCHSFDSFNLILMMKDNRDLVLVITDRNRRDLPPTLAKEAVKEFCNRKNKTLSLIVKTIFNDGDV